MAAESRSGFLQDCPGEEENMSNPYKYFMNRLRDNLHVVLCFSQMNEKFAIHAQKFPPKKNLYALMENYQNMVGDVCSVYFARMRKNVYVTQKTFLCLIGFYKELYRTK